jgi:Domain of unknown function (DUF1840)
MLVTFETKGYGKITMFGDVAKRLLTLMGHSGTVPSALAAADVPAALARLRAGLAALEPEEDTPPSQDASEPAEQRVGLARRAYTLIELLEGAVAERSPVSWR